MSAVLHFISPLGGLSNTFLSHHPEVSWSKKEHSKQLTVFSFITPEVSPVAEHDLQIVTLIKSS